MSKQQKLKKLKTELEKMESLHSWAWNQYGSELCANEMLAQEKRLREKIDKLEESIKKSDRNKKIYKIVKNEINHIIKEN